MGRKVRQYTDEEREAALDLCDELGSVSEAARELSIPYKTLVCWRYRLRPSVRSEDDADRGNDGRFVAGNRANPGGRSSARAHAERIAAEAAPAIVQRQVDLLEDLLSEDEERRARAIAVLEPGGKTPHVLALADRILDRGLGKATSRQELSGPDGGAIEIDGVHDLFTLHYGIAPGQGPDVDGDLERADQAAAAAGAGERDAG